MPGRFLLLYVMPDKYLLSLYISSTLIFVLVIFMITFGLVNYRNRLNKHMHERQLLMAAKLEEGERMMGQIAKEVHDNMGQVTNLLKLTLKRAEKATNAKQRAELFEQAYGLIESIHKYTENISHSLNSDFIKTTGLIYVVEDLAKQILRMEKVNCRFDLKGKIRPLHPDRELFVYRIIQEAVHNALEHAESSEIVILMEYLDDGLNVRITDNGKGFSMESAEKKDGIGLSNMMQRANVLNGAINFTTAPDKGCEVSLQFNYSHVDFSFNS